MFMKFSRMTGAAILALVGAVLTIPAHAADAEWPGIVEAKQIAEEGYVYGLPIVMNYAVMYDYAVDRNSGQFKAPFNEIRNEARVYTYKDTAVISPNSDTPYSVVSLDLRSEPIVLSVPSVEAGRYYSIQLVDGNTYNYGYVGSRATGNEPGDFMVVGPDWKGETPSGIKKVFRSSTQFALAIYRTQLFGPDDMPNVEKIQAGYKVHTLSAYLGKPAPAAAPAIDFPKVDRDLDQIKLLRVSGLCPSICPCLPGRGRDPRQTRQDRGRTRQDFSVQGYAACPPARNRARHARWRSKGEEVPWGEAFQGKRMVRERSMGRRRVLRR